MTNQGDNDAGLPDWMLKVLSEEGGMGPALACPHCGFAHTDPWEVLEQNRLDEMHCGECRKPFAFALMECDHCGAEKGFTWAHRPADATLDLLNCESCGRLYRQADESPNPDPDPEGL